jgi:F0F1-type ATP synthase delta subunit
MQLYKERMNIVEFSVTSAHELDAKNSMAVKRFLAKITGKTIMCTYSINTSLIAGMRLKSVEHMWEYSVRKRIESLQALEKGRIR